MLGICIYVVKTGLNVCGLGCIEVKSRLYNDSGDVG